MELNNSIGITSPGDMGQGVAMCIKAMGFKVCMASDGRSPRTRGLGEKAGLTDCGSLENLVKECDMVRSITCGQDAEPLPRFCALQGILMWFQPGR